MRIKYIEVDRKVVAVVDNCELDAYKVFVSKLGPDIKPFVSKERLLLKKKYRATAICHESDEFDVSIGREIARRRVMEKYGKDMTNKLEVTKSALEALLEGVDKSIEEYNSKYID